MQETPVFEAVVKRNRVIVMTGLLVVIALAWVYLLTGAGMRMTAVDMSSITLPWQTMAKAHMAMTQPAAWTPGYAGVVFGMWWVMMIAMMLPSASPMILIFAQVNRAQQAQGVPFVPTISLRPDTWPLGPDLASSPSACSGGWSAWGCYPL